MPPFSSLEALQAFGMGQQSAVQRRALERQEREYDRAESLRSGLIKAYDPTSGQVDPARAREAYVAAGDVPGAMQFDQQQAASQRAGLEANRENVQFVARLAQSATDQTSYERALQTMQRYGLDISSLPPQFDPAIVSQLQQEAAAFAEEPEMTPFQRDVAAAGIRPGSPEYREVVTNRYAPTRWVPVPEGGYLQGIGPDGRPIGTDGGQSTPQHGGQNEVQLRAAAEEAIRNGADPAAVNARLRQMLQGGPTQPASGNFR